VVEFLKYATMAVQRVSNEMQFSLDTHWTEGALIGQPARGDGPAGPMKCLLSNEGPMTELLIGQRKLLPQRQL